MPLYRLIAPMPHLEDATFSFDVNPDSDRYVDVDAPKAKAAKVEATTTEES